MDDQAPTTVTIQKGPLAAILLCLAFLAFVTWLSMQRSGGFAIGVMMGLFGLVGILYGLWFLYSAPCADCSAPYTGGVFPKDNDSLQCKACDKYFHTKGGRSIATSDTAIEALPVFAVPCPRKIVWPAGCCVCEAPVTRTVPVRLEVEGKSPLLGDFMTQAATLGTFRLVSKNTYEVSVPVCATHGEGSADLEHRAGEDQLYIRFRSRKYAKVFEQANGLTHLDA